MGKAACARGEERGQGKTARARALKMGETVRLEAGLEAGPGGVVETGRQAAAPGALGRALTPVFYGDDAIGFERPDHPVTPLGPRLVQRELEAGKIDPQHRTGTLWLQMRRVSELSMGRRIGRALGEVDGLRRPQWGQKQTLAITVGVSDQRVGLLYTERDYPVFAIRF
ncbi:hypothetical protein WNY37_16530 [Henriciella sp. AS95]|uniref:hypothetical protein n=1 Tax=Henriciella sp. AS95 TaxID=3135782 RepID=UPI003180CB81